MRSVRIKILSHVLLIMIAMAFFRANVSLLNSFIGTSYCDGDNVGGYGAYIKEGEASGEVKPIYDSNSLLMMV